MSLQLSISNSTPFLEGTAGTPLLNAPDDVVDVIGRCFEEDVRLVLLYVENLTSGFTDLKTGHAGTILQKLRNYHIRAAVVLNLSDPELPARFVEMASEENKGSHVRFFNDRDSAAAWLTAS